jgi:hypothetical protein
MPRIRTIKPDFFSNEQIGQLSVAARLLFVGLWTLSDREGRLQDRPVRISAQLFPYDVNLSVDSLLDDLAEAKLILRYEAEDKKCIQIINFTKHQHIHPNEPTQGLPGITGNSRTLPVNKGDSCIIDSGLIDSGHTHADATNPPQETKSARKTSEGVPKSRFSLKECRKYADSQRNIKVPAAFAKSIWRNGEADDEIAAFQANIGHSGKPMKKPPDKPVDVAAWLKAADELERVGLKDHAKEMRAAVKLE